MYWIYVAIHFVQLIEGPNILVENSQELLPLLHGFPTCEDLGLLKSENQVVCTANSVPWTILFQACHDRS